MYRSVAIESSEDFVTTYNAENRHERTEAERFGRFTYEELVARDKASLDIFWLRDEGLEDTDNLPAPAVIAAEIVEDLEAALLSCPSSRRGVYLVTSQAVPSLSASRCVFARYTDRLTRGL